MSPEPLLGVREVSRCRTAGTTAWAAGALTAASLGVVSRGVEEVAGATMAATEAGAGEASLTPAEDAWHIEAN